MLLITCPQCGPRDVTEFTYGGDAGVRRPANPQDVSDEQWAAYVFIRDNPRGEHKEIWQHSFGCRRWITVARNTYTHDIASTGLPE